MASSKLLAVLLLLLPLFTQFTPNHAAPSSNLFRSYIGAQFNNVKFTDVPINPDVEFHFILSFAIDATPDSSPTNGKFNIFWDSDNLSPSDVAAIKAEHPNVRVALSLGGDSVGHSFAFFNPSSVDSWVNNAVSSLTKIINEFHLDGIDIDYEHFKSDPDTFAQCIGQLITILKENKVISFASIAPFDNETVQRNYKALWAKHSDVIDFVNFQFYAFDELTVPEFLREFDVQRSNYEGGRVLASFITDGTTGGLSPENGFFRACNTLTNQGKLGGIFIWSADESKAAGFQQEEKSQKFLALN